MSIIENLFGELKILHNQLFIDGDNCGRYGDEIRKKNENLFFCKFVELVGHGDFVNGTIRRLMSSMSAYQGEQLSSALFQYSAQTFFIKSHSGQHGKHLNSMTSLCERSGPMEKALTVYQLRKYYINSLRYQRLDELRAEGEEVGDINQVNPELLAKISVKKEYESNSDQLDGVDCLDFYDIEHEENDTNENVSSPYAESDDDFEPLPDNSTLLIDRDVSVSDIQRSLTAKFGIQFANGEGVLSKRDFDHISIAANDFFNHKSISKSLGDLTRKRLGVWGAFYLKRDGTFQKIVLKKKFKKGDFNEEDSNEENLKKMVRHSIPATMSGYATRAFELGLGNPKVVGDSLNLKVGWARNFEEFRARKQTTLACTFFQERGWWASADDRVEDVYYKELIFNAFFGDLARIALTYIEDPKNGVLQPAYTDEDDYE